MTELSDQELEGLQRLTIASLANLAGLPVGHEERKANLDTFELALAQLQDHFTRTILKSRIKNH